MEENHNNKNHPHLVRFLDISVPAVRLFLTAIIIVCLSFGYVAWNSYQAEYRDGRVLAKNLAGVFESNFENILVRAQSDLLAFSKQINAADLQGTVSAERRDDIQARMASHLVIFPSVLNYRIFGKDGHSIFGAGAVNAGAAIDVSDRDWFRQLRDTPDRDVAVSEVLMGKGTGSQTIILGLAVRDAHGRFIGAVNAAFDLAYFQQQLDLLDIGPKGLITIRRADDFRLVLRRPAMAAQINEPVRDSQISQVVLSGQKSGEGEFVSSIDNVARVYAFRSLSKFPLTIIVAIAKDDFLSNWYKQLVFGGFIVFIFIFVSASFLRRSALAQNGLAKQFVRYHALMQTASDGVHILDRQGNLLEASDSFYLSLGYQGDVKPKLNVADWEAKWSPDTLIDDMLPGLLATPQMFETVHRRRDGSLFDVEVNARSVEIDGENYLYASSRDISRRKQEDRQRLDAEAEIRALAARLNLVLTTTAEGILGFDRASRLIFANPAAARILDWPAPESILGKRSDEIAGHRLADGTPCSDTTCKIRMTPQTGETQRSADEYFVTSAGKVIGVEYVVAPLMVGLDIVGSVVAFHDISERKAMEEQIRTANRELEQFAYVASHDLRQPLRTVASYLGLIRMRLGKEVLSEELQHFFDFAVGGAKRMDAMIIGLLEYSRTGKNGTPPQPVPLGEAVAESLLNLSAAVEESGAVISAGEDLPVISGDRLELIRLFQNLIGNAIKYRHADRPAVIDIDCLRDGQASVIRVRDNGIGIPAEDRERAFLIFQRVVARDAYEGTGIGLAVCRKIVEGHGGRIWLEESPGGGCMVLMAFPDALTEPH